MRKVILQLHLIVALTAGVFIVILGATGGIMAFEPELDRLVPRIAYVKPHGTPLPLAQIGEAVSKLFPNHQIIGYALPARPNLSYGVMIARPQPPFHGQGVLVDQYSGRVLGTMDGRNFVTFVHTFLGFVHQFHIRLGLLDKGRKFGEMTVRWSAFAALFLLISGAYLWWPRKQFGVAGRAGTARFWFDLHNTFGIVSLAFVLVLLVTGLVISFETQTTPFLYRISRSQPPLWPRMQVTPMSGQSPITPDKALAIARAAVPAATPNFITDPHENQPYLIFSRYPEDHTPGGRTRIAIDPYSGKILMVIDSRRAPTGYRLINLNRALHTGDIWGIPSEVAMSLASLILPLQLLTGVVVWRKRQRVESKATTVSNTATLVVERN